MLLSMVAGQYYAMAVPDASSATLQASLPSANLTAEEAELAWTGLFTTMSQTKVMTTLYQIQKTWEAPKQEALFTHITTTARAVFKLAFEAKYGTGAAAPLFVKM